MDFSPDDSAIGAQPESKDESCVFSKGFFKIFLAGYSYVLIRFYSRRNECEQFFYNFLQFSPMVECVPF